MSLITCADWQFVPLISLFSIIWWELIQYTMRRYEEYKKASESQGECAPLMPRSPAELRGAGAKGKVGVNPAASDGQPLLSHKQEKPMPSSLPANPAPEKPKYALGKEDTLGRVMDSTIGHIYKPEKPLCECGHNGEQHKKYGCISWTDGLYWATSICKCKKFNSKKQRGE